ncbi:cytosol alanyl aminopeptidase [Strigomonas culicis]|nr:cytosol alanyl aminopeptidase [Strigomonas culicis]|eukprot:EPY33142.1 cytosol alanyl aminopeptidase [Strigomonas culicis]
MTAALPLATPFAGHGILTIVYRGVINESLSGFYRSKYTTADGRQICLGTTQFEAVDARRALPCWDEPAHKAVFHLVLTAPTHMRALANMHVVDAKPSADGATTTWTFAPTPKMSTYLLAWTIGELDVISAAVRLPFAPDRDTLVSVYTPLGKSAQGEFALAVAQKVLALYESFFHRGYDLHKLDLVAIPDFAAGAMENWGLVTYREAALLCDDSSSASHRQYVAIVVAHELAHQWFGNLVTMEWWKELWLNESFATYMEYWAIHKLYPEWDVFTQFVQTEGSSAFQLDAMRSSHPVEVDVKNAQEIDEIFDAISYCKGGCVVRMAIEYIGEAAFEKGISAYIDHFKYANANTVDLWNFLGRAAGKDLAPIMKQWTAEQGYPYLSVAAEPGAAHLTVTQHRFLATGEASGDEDKTVWTIPLLLRTPNGETATLVTDRVAEIALPAAGAAWVKVNSRQTAFCRVKYDDALLRALAPAIQGKALTALDRLGIIGDYHAFARAGYVPLTATLELLTHFAEGEDDYSVWSAIADLETNTRRLVSVSGEQKAVDALNVFCQRLYRVAMDRVGYTLVPGEAQNVTQLRGLLFNRLVAARDERTMEVARALYAAREHTPVPADLHQAVVSLYVREGGLPAVEAVQQQITTITDAVERARCLRALALGCPASIAVSDLFDFAFSDKVRSQDSMYLLGAVAARPKAAKSYADEITKRWRFLLDTVPGFIVGRMIKFVEYGADVTVADTLHAFWATVSEEDKLSVGRSFHQGVEGLLNNANWAQRDAARVVQWLEARL